MSEEVKNSENTKSLIIFFLLGVASMIMWHFIPFGTYILHPFVVLSTWFHEMGHGLMALILGGDFLYLEMMPNGSGFAVHTTDLFLGSIGSGIVAAAGPIAPTIAGAVFVMGSKNLRRARLINFLFSIVLAVSIAIWVRSIFGIISMSIFAVLFFIISVYGKPKFNQYVTQFIGIQAFMSLYLDIDYFFTGTFIRDGKVMYSDTYVMQQTLLLPYWIWASILTLLSLLLIILSFRKFAKN